MIELIKDVKPDLVSINRLLLMPGTKLYEDPDVYGIKFITKKWYENECWTDKQLCCTEKLSYEQIEELSILMRKSFLLEKLDEK